MNCQDIQKFAYTYLDGEFDDRDQVEFQTHLGMCPPCRDTVERDATFRDAVRRHLSPSVVDPSVREGVLRRLAEAHNNARMSRTVAIPLALAASLALAVVSWQAIQQNTPDQGQVASTAPAQLAAALPAPPPPTPAPTVAVKPAKKELMVAAAPTQPPKAVAITPLPVNANPALAPTDRLNPVKLVSNKSAGGKVLEARQSPFGAIRSPSSLRAMVRSHVRPLPPEVRGRSAVVQRFLRERLPFVGSPPIADGVGVQLHGARLTRFVGRPVVHYYYEAYGKPLTVFRFMRGASDEPFEDPEVERASPGDPRTVTESALLDQLAGYSILHSLRGGELTCLVSELGGDELHHLVRAPTVL